jgi:hypothetical protein
MKRRHNGGEVARQMKRRHNGGEVARQMKLSRLDMQPWIKLCYGQRGEEQDVVLHAVMACPCLMS